MTQNVFPPNIHSTLAKRFKLYYVSDFIDFSFTEFMIYLLLPKGSFISESFVFQTLSLFFGFELWKLFVICDANENLIEIQTEKLLRFVGMKKFLKAWRAYWNF